MSMKWDRRAMRIPAAVMAASGLLLTLGFGASTWWQRHRSSRSSVHGQKDLKHMNCLEFCEWMSRAGVSAPTLQFCSRGGFTGAYFYRKDERAIGDLGICEADARIIAAAYAEPRAGTVTLSSVLADGSSVLLAVASPGTTDSREHAVRVAIGLRNFLAGVCELQPHEQREVADAFIRCVDEMVGNTAAVSAPPAAAPFADIPSTIQSLHDMMAGFVEVLQSDDIHSIAPEDYAELTNRVRTQVLRVGEVADRLPQEEQAALRSKCHRVLELLAAQRPHLSSQSGTGKSALSTTVPVQTLLSRLKELFEKAKATTTLEMDPAERMALIQEMMKELHVVQDATQELTDEKHVIIVKEVVSSVLGVLRQLLALTNEQLKTPLPSEEADKMPGTAHGLPAIASAVQSVLQVLQSPQFISATREAKAVAARQLYSRVEELLSDAKTLPAAEQSSIANVLASVRDVLRSLVDDSANTNSVSEQGNDEATGRTGTDGDLELRRAMDQIEEVFHLVTSKRFECAPSEQRRAIAGELVERVRSIKQSILQHTQPTHPIMKDFVLPLEDLLSHMVDGRPASERFRLIETTFKKMKEVLASPDFARATPAERAAVIRTVAPQVQLMVETFSELSPSEQVAANELAKPIQELLRTVEESSPRGSFPTEDVIFRLKALMERVQSAAFVDATPAARTVMVKSCLEELEELRQHCERAGDRAAPLLPMVERFTTQLQCLLPDAPLPASENGATQASLPPASEEREELLAAVTEISAELQRGVAEGLQLSDAELVPLQSLLDTLDDVGCETEKEQQLRDTFAGQLLRARQGVGVAAGDTQPDAERDPQGGNDKELQAFVQMFSSLRDRVMNVTLSSPSQLLQLMKMAEQLLGMADKGELPWRDNEEAVTIVSVVLSLIQEKQRDMDAAEANSRGTESSPQRQSSGGNGDSQVQAALQELLTWSRRALPDGTQPTEATEGQVTEALLEISDMLRNRVFPNEALDAYEAVVAELGSRVEGESFKEAVGLIREQIRLNRFSNQNVSEGDETNSHDDDDESDDGKSASTDEKDGQNNTSDDDLSQSRDDANVRSANIDTGDVNGEKA